MTLAQAEATLSPVEPAYRTVLRVRAAIFWLPAFVGSLVVDRLVLADLPVAGLAPLLVGLLAVGGIGVFPARTYRRLGFAIDSSLLRVVRGWLFHTDTIVPLVRVQHIDVTSGPIDKLFGTASLVVHTAGTHNSVVVLPGLAPARAAEMRETMRAAIRTDAE